jgi:3-hydroxybutyryl-CoA dehydrogenase
MRPTARATQEDDVARTVEKVGVVGLGTMGSGIAQLCIQAGVPTVAIEGSDELVERGRGRIDTQLARAVEKGRLEEGERERMLGLLDATTDVSSLAGCDLVIEAVFEDLAVKLELFGRVEKQLADDAVLATNTSALSVTQIAGGLERPGRLVGMHFFNPAPVLPLVEIVRSELSDDDAFDTAYAFGERIGKEPIACRDTPGFVVNRILIPVLNDAVRVLDEGAASAEDIDKGMRLGTNWPIGPLALIDLIGIDVHVHVCEVLWDAFREPRFAPPPRLVRMVQAGLLGRKSGRGFYRYDT